MVDISYGNSGGSDKAFIAKTQDFLKKLYKIKENRQRTMFEILELPSYRKLVGLENEPDYHATIEVIDYHGCRLAKTSTGDVLDWDYVRHMSFADFMGWAQMKGMVLSYPYDGRIASLRLLLPVRNVAAEIIQHPHVDNSHSEDLVRALGISTDLCIRCLIFNSASRSNYGAAAIVGKNQKLDVKQLEILSGFGELKEADATFIKGMTGFSPNGVPPPVIHPFFENKQGNRPTYIEESLLALDAVYCAASSFLATLKISPAEIVRLGAKPAKIVQG